MLKVGAKNHGHPLYIGICHLKHNSRVNSNIINAYIKLFRNGDWVKSYFRGGTIVEKTIYS